MAAERKPRLEVLNSQCVWPLPIWQMRQGGAHLRECREIRAKGVHFVALCTVPETTAEVIIQPVRRFRLIGRCFFGYSYAAQGAGLWMGGLGERGTGLAATE